jgi:hypothetical protein
MPSWREEAQFYLYILFIYMMFVTASTFCVGVNLGIELLKERVIIRNSDEKRLRGMYGFSARK